MKRLHKTFHRFDTDPRVRHSVWTLAIGGGVYWCAVFGTNQAQVQRAIAVRSVSMSKLYVHFDITSLEIYSETTYRVLI